MSKVTLLGLILIVKLTLIQQVYGSHAAGADLSYECLGGDNYEITLTFYRDCSGITVGSSEWVDIGSVSCGFTATANDYRIRLDRFGPVEEVTPICPSQSTVCTGGTLPGIQKYTYKGLFTFPQQCADWTIGWQKCCRNGAITTINTPSSENMYIEATLNNTGANRCNNSPTFTNNPIPFVCLNNHFCFNHGAIDTDADSLMYSLITPMTSVNSTVTYSPGYNVNNPITSSPGDPFTLDAFSGNVCMTAQLQEITVFAVLVEEYKNGQVVGSVLRDIQMYTEPCSNTLPNGSGFDSNPINGSNTDTTVCAGSPLNFNIIATDADNGDLLTLSWNNGIPGANFSVDYSDPDTPRASFTWTPTANDAGAVHCFTVTVLDDNCPYFGSFTQAYCITVTGISVDAGADLQNAACNVAHNALGTASGGVMPYTYLWSSGDNTPSAVLGCGTHMLTVSDATGCLGYDSITINCPEITIDSFIVHETCFGLMDGSAWVDVSNGTTPYNYLWNNLATTDSISGLTQGIYKVTVTDAGGCIDSAHMSVFPGAFVSQVYIFAENRFCITDPPVVFDASIPNPLLNWQGAGMAGNIFSPAVAGSGVHQIIAIYTNPCGINDTISIEVEVIGVDDVIVTDASCFGYTDGSVEFVLSGSPDSIVVYNGVDTTTLSGLIWPNLGIGTYYIIGAYLDTLLCPVDSMGVVDQPALLKAGLTKANMTCFNVCDGNIIATPQGGTAPYSYVWSNGTNGINLVGLCDGNYSVTLTDNRGCQADSATVIQRPLPFNFSTTTLNANCGQADGQASIVYNSGGAAPISYLWSAAAGGGTGSSALNLIPGSYTYTISDNFGCDTVGTVLIGNNPPPTASLSITPAVCYGDCNGTAEAVAMGGTSPGLYNFLWSNGATTNQINGLCAGNYTVTVTDLNNCSVIETILVSQPTELLVKANPYPDTSICIGQKATLFAGASGGSGTYSFSWTNGWNGPGPHTDYPSSPTCYSVLATDDNGCAGQLSTSCVNLYDSISVLAFSDQTICEGSIVNLSAIATGGHPDSSITLIWSTGEYGSNISHQSLGAYPNQEALVVTAIDGCSPNATAQVVLDFHMPPVPSFTPMQDTICPGDTVIFTNTTPLGYISCLWDFYGNASSACQGSTEWIFNNPGDYAIQLTVYSPQGCPGISTGNIHVVQAPVANFDIRPNPTNIQHMVITLDDQSFGNITSWDWVVYDNENQLDLMDTLSGPIVDYDFASSSTNSLSALNFLNDTGQYPIVLTITSEEGCYDEITKYATILGNSFLVVPNAFTPNGDGKNDYFFPVGYGIATDDEYEFSIFDRWGELIFQSHKLNDPWDGTAKEIGGDAPVKMDVYVWKLRYKTIAGELNYKQGIVTCITGD